MVVEIAGCIKYLSQADHKEKVTHPQNCFETGPFSRQWTISQPDVNWTLLRLILWSRVILTLAKHVALSDCLLMYHLLDCFNIL